MEPISLSRIVAWWAERQPDAPAVTHESRTLTWSEFDARTNRLARAYAERGVQADDFVTIALPNGIAFFEATFATWKLGATPQPVSAKLPPAELGRLLEVGQPRLVVGVEASAHPEANTLPADFEPDPALSDAELPERTATSFKAMTSGGSTGRPKLIVSKLPAAWDPELDYLNFGISGAVLIPGPLYHNGPFSWAVIGLFKGNHVVVTTRFDAEQTLALIEAHRIDTLYLVPTMMQRIWNLPEATRQRYDLSSLQTAWHLAAPCPQWLKENWIGWLGPEVIWELYGGTEGQGATTIRGDEWLEHKGSVGRPVETCEMKIVDEDGNELAPGEIGEVFMRPKAGPGTTYRYIGDTPRAIAGGWESIGDMGYLDAEGYLYLTDRRADMILRGGANIYPAEVEAAIDAFPGVRSSAVIGLPDPELGNSLHAIVDAPSGNVDEPSLRAHMEQQLVSYKRPASYEFTTEPVRDDAGKVRRKALREARISARDSAPDRSVS